MVSDRDRIQEIAEKIRQENHLESCVTIGVVALELGRANRLAAAFQVQPINHIDIVDVTELHFGRMIPIEAIRCTRFPNCRGYI